LRIGKVCDREREILRVRGDGEDGFARFANSRLDLLVDYVLVVVRVGIGRVEVVRVGGAGAVRQSPRYFPQGNGLLTLVGHITKAELLRHLADTEVANGFANRFMWVMVKRSKELPFGGEWHKVDTTPLVGRLSSALELGSAPVLVTWGDSAREIWPEVYGPLSDGKLGLFGAVTGRAEAQVVRLAALYAVVNESYEIEREHLLAALALWDYAEKSALYIFGAATGDSVADQIFNALRAAGKDGMTRTEISNLFGRNMSSERIAQALSLLLGARRVRRKTHKTGGRQAERWYAA
jgi:hypothetical protein